ncbi:FERM domain-containing protein 4A-like isoform X4 [Lethenteron reissneri]|uniref:FERM domain-containing protein 4A-like isoform X4 n=1 Tax=Lethenteron reissneri TaxID=7753 RepID=UPI002AB739A9|nr:FERM domain-containing protein 4A-like isoform X4 [Lethenteron reissneri]
MAAVLSTERQEIPLTEMTEGRRCQINLLDDRKLELLVQPKLLGKELLDLVASHVSLKEKEYFGLAYTDEIGHWNWLHLERRVLDHEFCRTSGPVVLFFSVRFYIESIAFLKDSATIRQFFLNAKACVASGNTEVDSDTTFELAAYVLQEAKGDFSSVEAAQRDLKKLPAIPTQALKEHPSLCYCEERVIENYQRLVGLTHGQAIVNYMSIIEALPTYGIHYYNVKDKQGIPWWLGLSWKGIFQYDYQDRVQPRKVFHWAQLENLFFREKKFSVEVHDPRRASVGRRSFGQGDIVVHSWYGTPSLIKAVWAMAISQHQFYLDRKQNKAKIPAARSMSEIAEDMGDLELTGTSRMSKGLGEGGVGRGSSVSLEWEVSEAARKDLLEALKLKHQELARRLEERTSELKRLCLREAELTGTLPVEYPKGPGEKLPAVRRRVGTTFRLDENKVFPKVEQEEDVERLEREFAIQQKIVEAAHKLARDPNITKKVRKKRKAAYTQDARRLQAIEDAINELRLRVGKKPTERTSVIITDDSILMDDGSQSDGVILDDDEPVGTLFSSTHSTPQKHPATFTPVLPRRSERTSRHPPSLRGSQRYLQTGTTGAQSPSSTSTCSPQYSPQIRSLESTPARAALPSPRQPLQRSSSLESVSSRSAATVSATAAAAACTPGVSRRVAAPSAARLASSAQLAGVGGLQSSSSSEHIDDGSSSYTSQSSAELPGGTSRRREGDGERRRRWRQRPDETAGGSGAACVGDGGGGGGSLGGAGSAAGSMPNLASANNNNNGVHRRHQPSHLPEPGSAGGSPMRALTPSRCRGYDALSEGRYNVHAFRNLHHQLDGTPPRDPDPQRGMESLGCYRGNYDSAADLATMGGGGRHFVPFFSPVTTLAMTQRSLSPAPGSPYLLHTQHPHHHQQQQQQPLQQHQQRRHMLQHQQYSLPMDRREPHRQYVSSELHRWYVKKRGVDFPAFSDGAERVFATSSNDQLYVERVACCSSSCSSSSSPAPPGAAAPPGCPSPQPRQPRITSAPPYGSPGHYGATYDTAPRHGRTSGGWAGRAPCPVSAATLPLIPKRGPAPGSSMGPSHHSPPGHHPAMYTHRHSIPNTPRRFYTEPAQHRQRRNSDATTLDDGDDHHRHGGGGVGDGDDDRDLQWMGDSDPKPGTLV